MKVQLVAILLFSFGFLARSDLPVHCLKSQEIGTWNIELSAPYIPKGDDNASCGHKSPDDPNTSNEDGLDDFVANTKFQIRLYSNTTAEKIDGATITKGNWTMIYDQGFDIVFENERFTNNFYYSWGLFSGYSSECGKTAVGWYANTKGERACWTGEKEASDDEDLVNQVTEMTFVVQPEEYRVSKRKHSQKASSSLESQGRASNAKKRTLRSEAASGGEFEEPQVQKRATKYNKDFKNHKEIVDKLNNGKRSWRAKVYPEYESKTLGDLNKMAGRKATLMESMKNSASFIQKSAQSDVSDLPKEWSWADQLGGYKEQGGCGSCFLVATLQMLEARLKIKYNESVTLSIQYPLDCSYYNQGCDGGYPYLAELWASQYGLVSEDSYCKPYTEKHGACGECDLSQVDKMYKVESFRFVGGSYGASNERNMMLELMNNGPLVVSLETSDVFMYYESGVYESGDAEWLVNGEEKPEWEKVSHSVLLYGWGETDDGLKYWIMRNSWGPYWGENGSFRIKRGVDDSAVESLAEAADPIIVNL